MSPAANLRQRAIRVLTKRVLQNPYIPKRPWVDPETGETRVGPTAKQAVFLLAPHREALYGGAAGGGKSDALLMGALMFADVPGYAALLLRRSYADLNLPGAIMDRAAEWLTPTDARWNEPDKTWTFPSGATLTFGYLQAKADHYRYSSAEFQYVAFDELTQFAEGQYRFLHSRLRRLKGSKVPIRLRSATNPIGPGKPWVRQRFLVEGPTAVDDETGLPEPRLFVPARLDDNPALDRADYLRSLAALDPVTRAQLLNGDWDVRPPGSMFPRENWDFLDDVPLGPITAIRYWDTAATEEAPGIDPDWTVGAKVVQHASGLFIVEDVIRRRLRPRGVEDLVRATAEYDGKSVAIWIQHEPGSQGKIWVDHMIRELAGWPIYGDPVPRTNKAERAKPLSAQAEAKAVKLVRAPWNRAFMDEAESFPDVEHDDQVDAVAGGFNVLTGAYGKIQKRSGAWG